MILQPAGQGPHQPGPSPTALKQERARDGSQVQPRAQNSRHIHSVEAGPRPSQEVKPQVQSTEGDQDWTQSSGHHAGPKSQATGQK